MQHIICRRLELLDSFTDDEKAQAAAKVVGARDIVQWWNDWLWTYDPRYVEKGSSAFQPFDLWPKQREYLRWLEDRVAAREEFVVEKSRDAGLSYLNGGFALHRWLFFPGFKTTFGANKENKVDRLGDADSIFEKIRIMLGHLPRWMWPEGFDRRRHDLFMRLINPSNGNIISGEAGDNMGRGGRATLYIIDEAAHVDRAEKVDAATSATSECRGWVSSVAGMGNVFARKRHSGRLPVFRFHWKDDPRKTPEWAAQKKASLSNPAIWASEYDINYAASVEGVVIPGEWVMACQQLGEVAAIEPTKHGVAGLDVGAGKAESVYLERFGCVMSSPEAWTDPDTTDTALRALGLAQASGAALLNFDPVGVGAGVTSTLKKADRNGIAVQGVNVGRPPTKLLWPDGRKSEEIFSNLKAELWWLTRERCKKSFERVQWELGEDGGIEHPLDECLALPKDEKLAVQLSLPKWFRRSENKIIIETKEQLRARGVASPDRAEAAVLCQCPDLMPRMRQRELPLG